MKICITVLVLTTVFFSCVSKPSYYSIDPKTGYFPITSTLPNDAVVAKEKFNESKYKPMLLFRANDQHTDNFFIQSIRQMNYFQKVETLPKHIFSSTSLYYLHDGKGIKVAEFDTEVWVKSRLPFLAVEVNREFIGGFRYEMEVSLKAIDPETKNIVLHLRKRAPFLYMIETDFYSPLLNGFLEWVKGTEIIVDQK